MIFWVGLIVWQGCVEPFEFSAPEAEEALVVDAVFTDEQRAHQVKLSWSGALDATGATPATGASVWLVEGGGTQIDFTEVESGTYETLATIQGESGKSYTLFIRLQNGAEYRSATEILPQPIPIDSVYGRYMEMPSTENDQILTGIQFFVDAHNDDAEFSNFRYEYEEDYEIRVPYPSLFDWDEATESFFSRGTDISTCYGRAESITLTIATTSGQSENRLAEFPIRMVAPNEGPLNHRYALTVTQFAISTAAYQYYKRLKENNESAGSFFDRQKGAISGNIIRLSESAPMVQGYFEASAVSRTRRFFTPYEFLDQGFLAVNPFRATCFSSIDSIGTAFLNNTSLNGKNIVRFTFPLMDIAIVVSEYCSDCRVHGKLEKPEFWD